jgi:hypothetical protein
MPTGRWRPVGIQAFCAGYASDRAVSTLTCAVYKPSQDWHFLLRTSTCQFLWFRKDLFLNFGNNPFYEESKPATRLPDYRL